MVSVKIRRYFCIAFNLIIQPFFVGKSVSLNEYSNNTVDYDLDTKENRLANSAELAWAKVSKILADIVFLCPTVKLANRYSENRMKKTFFYRFNKRADSNPLAKWLGVMHGYEIEYIFGRPFTHAQLYDEEDRLISRNMMSYWAYFAKYGKL